MSFVLRTLSIHDVVRALKQRKLRVAFGISRNLVSNTVNSARFRLRLRSHRPLRRAVRRPS